MNVETHDFEACPGDFVLLGPSVAWHAPQWRADRRGQDNRVRTERDAAHVGLAVQRWAGRPAAPVQLDVPAMNYATLSPDRVYRYLLTRDVSSLRSRDETVTFVMLNPSTADEHENDPTIRRCMGFAKTWGFATLQVVNLYAYRATDPTELMKRSFEVDVVGNPDNDAAIGVAVKASDLVVCAWGANARGNANRLGKVLSMIPEPHCLGRTLDGFPRHPLYLRRFEVPVPFAHCPPEAAWRTRFVNGSTTEATA